MAGLTQSMTLVTGIDTDDCYGPYHGFVASFTSGALTWHKFFRPDTTVSENNHIHWASYPRHYSNESGEVVPSNYIATL